MGAQDFEDDARIGDVMLSLRIPYEVLAMLDAVAGYRGRGRWLRKQIRRAYSRLPAERQTAGDARSPSNQRARVANSTPER